MSKSPLERIAIALECIATSLAVTTPPTDEAPANSIDDYLTPPRGGALRGSFSWNPAEADNAR